MVLIVTFIIVNYYRYYYCVYYSYCS